MMKAYKKLVFEMIEFSENDVVRTSLVTEADVTVKDEWDGRTFFN